MNFLINKNIEKFKEYAVTTDRSTRVQPIKQPNNLSMADTNVDFK